MSNRHPNFSNASAPNAARRWEETELETLKAKGIIGEELDEEFSKRRKQYKEPTPVDTTDLPELPESWRWVALGEVSEWVTDGTHQPPPFAKEGIPFLVISNMINGKIEWDKVSKWVSPEAYEKYTGIYKPTRGDVIYSIVGSYGVAVEITTERQFMFQRHIAAFRPFPKLLSVTYLTHAFNSGSTKSQADRVARGVAQKTINLSDLRRFLIPLAPLAEQNALAKLLEKLLQRVEGEQVALKSSLEYLDTIDQALLAKAFRGELVPQDPNDEPASVLLERIREEKARKAPERKTSFDRGEKMKPKEDEQRNVLTVLQQAKRAMTPEEIFMACGFDEESVDIFYEQLRHTVVGKQIRETRDGDSITLEMVKP